MSETKNELTQEIEEDQAKKLEELKEYATELEISFRENIGIAKLEYKITEKEDQIAKQRRDEKVAAKELSAKKVKIIIEPRDRDEGINDQFFGLNSLELGVKENVRIQFGEEVDVSYNMYNHIKSITYSEKKYKMVTGEDGQQKKQWYNKKQTRFIVSKV